MAPAGEGAFPWKDGARGRLRALPVPERPRERLFRLGAQALSEVELVAVVLGQGSAGQDVLSLAERVLADTPEGLRGLLTRSPQELASLPGVGAARAARLCAALEMGRRALEQPASRPQLGSPLAVHRLMAPRLGGLGHEEFWVLVLDSRHRLLEAVRVGQGGPSSTPADPRAVYRPAVRLAASAVVVVHNHPSGDPSPSDADQLLTGQLRQAGDILGIRLEDHVIVASGGYFSFRYAKAQGVHPPPPGRGGSTQADSGLDPREEEM